MMINSIKKSYPKIECNQKNHEHEFISHVCLRADCEEQRAHCRVCNLTQHRRCVGHVHFIEEVALQIEAIQTQFTLIFQIVEQTIQKLQNLRKELDSSMDFILKYIQLPNIFNLNQLARILHCCPQYDIEKLQAGKQLLDNLIQENFLRNIKKNVQEKQKEKGKEQQQQQQQQQALENDKKKENQVKAGNNSQINENNLDILLGAAIWHEKGIKNNIIQDKPIITIKNILKLQNVTIRLQVSILISLHFGIIKALHQIVQIEIQKAFNSLREQLNQQMQTRKLIKLLNYNIQTTKDPHYLDQVNLRIQFIFLMKSYHQIHITKQVLNQNFRHQLNWAKKIKQADLLMKNCNQPQKVLMVYFLKVKTFNFSFGIILIGINRIDEAIEVFCLSNSIDPKAQTYLALGKALEQLARYDEAEQSYLSALEHDENCAEAKQNLEIVQKYLYQK